MDARGPGSSHAAVVVVAAIAEGREEELERAGHVAGGLCEGERDGEVAVGPALPADPQSLRTYRHTTNRSELSGTRAWQIADTLGPQIADTLGVQGLRTPSARRGIPSRPLRRASHRSRRLARPISASRAVSSCNAAGWSFAPLLPSSEPLSLWAISYEARQVGTTGSCDTAVGGR